MNTKITTHIGRRGDGPLRPVVMLDEIQDFMTASEARRFAARLLKAADAADRKYVTWTHRRSEQTLHDARELSLAADPGRSGK